MTQRLTTGLDWLDAHGRWAWFAFFILSLMFFAPLALVVAIAYFVRTPERRAIRNQSYAVPMRRGYVSKNPTGNAAFDAYRDATIKRLEDEQAAFQNYLEKLRQARDKSEFDAFMDEYKADTPEDAKIEDAEIIDEVEKK